MEASVPQSLSISLGISELVFLLLLKIEIEVGTQHKPLVQILVLFLGIWLEV